MRPSTARALGLAAGLGVAATFPLPFYLGMGVLGWKQRWQIALLALIGLGIALLAVFVAMRVQRALGTVGAPQIVGRSARDWAAEKRRLQAMIAAEPALERWRDLVERWGHFDEAALMRYERRYQELLRHPLGAPYAEMLLKGDWRADEEIAYAAEPDRVVTCAHLAPIERDLRREGIRSAPVLHAERRLWTEACLALKRLAPNYELAGVDEEVYYDHPRDPGYVLIRCRGCDSAIDSRGGVRFPPEA